jgi:threonylcarbamoyladenosine tRNA methylthiotransferase MtaB
VFGVLTVPAFHIENFGCRATQADAAAIERQLLERGYARAEVSAEADLVVVNTCTVTASADAQARQAIRRLHRQRPAARILVTGCYAQRAPEELAALEGVTWVVGNSHKSEIPSLAGQALLPVLSSPQFFPVAQLHRAQAGVPAPPMPKILSGDIFEQHAVLVAPVFGGEGGRTRPVLKIQDGCNSRCLYCVIPFVRGRSRSLPPAEVVAEIRKLTGAGYKEVVLSGINLGSYGRDLAPRVEFIDLLRRILDETPLERLRISSIEPMDVTQDLVELVASTDRLAPHFHIPLQSGSDRILAAMHRWYRAAHYARRVALIRELLPDAALGADVITGFPGETEDDHQATLRFIEALPFTYLHVFAFSARPGTEAARLLEAGRLREVPPAVIKRRSAELRALAAEKSADFRAAQAGKVLRVLTLHRKGDGWTEALSGNYLKVRLAGRRPANRFVDARIISAADSHLLAVAEESAPQPPGHTGFRKEGISNSRHADIATC